MTVEAASFLSTESWDERVKCFFDEHTQFSAYRDACLEKDLEKVKKELANGAFPDYFMDTTENCVCGLKGCSDLNFSGSMDFFEGLADYFHFADEFILMLEFGLIKQN